MQKAGATHYQVLGVAETASEEELRRSYRRLALQWHPVRRRGRLARSAARRLGIDAVIRVVQDKNGSPEAEATFTRVAEAFEVLSDAATRAAYDEQLARARRPTSSASGDARRAHTSASTYPYPPRARARDVDPFQLFASLFGQMHADPFGGFGEGPFASESHLPPAFGGHPAFASPFAAARAAHPATHPAFRSHAGHFPAAEGPWGGPVRQGGYSSVSSSSTTTVVNGLRVTRTTRTVRHADGRVESSETCTESSSGVAAAAPHARGTLPHMFGASGSSSLLTGNGMGGFPYF